MNGRPRVIVIAGPNGAGKTTFAREFLNSEACCPAFINADLIAAGLAPFEPEKAAVRAGKLMLELMQEKFQARESFAIETTLSGRAYIRHISKWRAAGHRVSLHFLWMDDVELAIGRVALRVSQGGHHIEEHVIRRRFDAGLQNFNQNYRWIVDEWVLYNANEWTPVRIDWGVNHEYETD